MNIKEKINNLDNLTKEELVELIRFYLELVNKSFNEAEQCSTCNESCCDIFKNNYSVVKKILDKILLYKIESENKHIEKETVGEDITIENNLEIKKKEYDYLASIEINNLEKKYL